MPWRRILVCAGLVCGFPFVGAALARVHGVPAPVAVVAPVDVLVSVLEK